MKLTMRESVLIYLSSSTSEPHTATQLAKILNVNLASLSSVLKKMTDDDELQRVDGHGPRGGYGYVVRNS